ncbi:MAG: hypothetical protein ACHQJD_06495 [Thermoanaerobaculia bacterium]
MGRQSRRSSSGECRCWEETRIHVPGLLPQRGWSRTEAGLASTMLRLWREDETRERLVAKGAARATAYAEIDVAGAYHELLGSMHPEET